MGIPDRYGGTMDICAVEKILVSSPGSHVISLSRRHGPIGSRSFNFQPHFLVSPPFVYAGFGIGCLARETRRWAAPDGRGIERPAWDRNPAGASSEATSTLHRLLPNWESRSAALSRVMSILVILSRQLPLHSTSRPPGMATPSSSGTSPSPALSFALPATASENSTDEPNDVDQAEREERRKKLLARMEFAKPAGTGALNVRRVVRGHRVWSRYARNVPLTEYVPLVAIFPGLLSSLIQLARRLSASCLSVLVAPCSGRARRSADIGPSVGWARITRALRSTLALASYKTRHNVANVPLRNLEAQVAQRGHININNQPTGQASPSLFPATFANDKKRKATNTASNTGFYSSPLAQGSSSYSMGRPGLGTSSSSSNMGMTTAHSSYTFPPPSPGMSSGPSNPSRSLFASILSLPPAKRARTIHNPDAPLVPPPSPPPQAQSKRSPKKSTKKGKEPAGSGKGRAVDKKGKGKGKEREKKGASGRGRANSISSIHTHSSFSAETDNVNDTDMKAAETLTDLLFSRTTGTASPRSSFSAPTSASRTAPAGPTIGAHSLSKASSASSVAAGAGSQSGSHVRTASNASTASVSTNIMERDHRASPGAVKMETRRSATPTVTPRLSTRTAPGLSVGGSLSAQATHVFGAPVPSGQHSADSEAADLMLLLANSPSPARPTVPRDHDITRNAYAAGRVLFPSGSNGSGQASELGSVGSRSLTRSMGGSSLSGESAEMIRENEQRAWSDTATTPPSSQGEASPPHIPKTAIGPPTPEQNDGPTASPDSRPSSLSLGQLLPSPPSLPQTGPQTPAPAFRLTDYINVTPSPAAPASASQTSAVPHPSASSQPFPSSLGSGPSGRFGSTVSVSSPLRKSFDRDSVGLGMSGRKLFEDEPGGADMGGGAGGTAKRMRFGEDVDGANSLGSGIDLVQT
ncbi:uncharacterized protein FOMMEDRAFT_165657 [Fomitiporia mediterranea MF3/22]|uniref:uncharacterized protein n=1 Tax=Fomitiporia mediterranea (strain MF3/22) TaxID=694068 RepID=UPI0004408E00|nr:uncharacterized protein FOMMEDRAFT_165657 [Fomitiporia mediterranea MF3/22]EJD07024.1 hypothetical protein FOMMEDRAFT_165657 [Fomitiporia mediterranea MF3/22]